MPQDEHPSQGDAREARSTMAGLTDYGFRWGPMEVTRIAIVDTERRILEVKTATTKVNIYVSAQGRSVRVFKDGVEMVPGEDDDE